MEALAIVGLASAIVQFVDFSSKVISRLNDFHSTTKRAPKAFQGLRNELPLLLDTLQSTKEQCEHGQISKQSEKALIPVVEDCHQQVKLLDDILLKLLPVPADSSWNRTRKALRSIRKETEVQEIAGVLKSHVQELTHFQATGHTTNLNLAIRQFAKPDSPGVTPAHFLIPPHIVFRYVDRPVLMKQLEDSFVPGSRDASQVSVLVGMGGQGKSQLTLKLCQAGRASGRYGAIFWIDSTSNSTLEASIANIAAKLNAPQSLDTFSAQLRFTKDCIEEWRSPWLLVFDNYDRPDSMLNISTCFPQSPFGHIVVTSRHTTSKRLGIAIRVTGMSQTESLDLLFSRSELQRSEEHVRQGKSVVEQLGYHPLAIDQAGTFISSKNLTMEGFLSQYKDKKQRILQYTPALSEYRKKLNNSDAETSLNVFTTLELSLEAVPGDESNRAALEDFLTLSAFFNISRIGEDLFQACQSDDTTWLRLFKTDVWSHEKFEDVIEMLNNLSLIQSILSEELTCFSLHPLVADWLKLRRDLSSCRRFTLESGSLIETCIDEVDLEGLILDSRQYLLAHVGSCLDDQLKYLITADYETIDLLDQLWSFSRLFQSAGYLDQSVGLCNRVLIGCEKALGPDHAKTLGMVDQLGSLYGDQGKLGKAEQIHMQALRGREKTLGKDHNSTLQTVNNLGLIYRAQGKRVEAEQMFLRALAGKEKELGSDHKSTLNTVHNLGILYSDQGKLVEAEEMYLRALAGKESSFGPDHTSTLQIVMSLADLYTDQKNFTEAEHMQLRARTGCEKTLGPRHVLTLSSVGNLGRLYFEQGRLVEAEDMYNQALAGYEKAVGLSHNDSLNIVYNLALVYEKTERLSLAAEAFGRAAIGYRHLHGDEHFETIDAYSEFERVQNMLAVEGKP